MQAYFTYPPSIYKAESEKVSKSLSVWLPIFIALLLVGLGWFRADILTAWFFNERTGIAEFLHFLLPILTSVIALRLLFYPFIRKDKLLLIWCIAMVVGGVYLGGEEASWGQHYIGWTTSEYWASANDQNETNLHNISHWLDQKPRLILTIGICAAGLIWPYLLLKMPKIPPRRFDFIYAPLALTTVAAIVLLAEVYLHFRWLVPETFVKTFRTGEFQETFIVWYLFGYALCLLQRAKRTVETT